MKKIKICGLQSSEDISIVNKYKPDYIGYIFYPKSKRFISYSRAALLNHLLDENIQSVGVFVNEKISRIIEAVHTVGIDIVQLHGDENESYIKQLKRGIDCKIIKVFKATNNTIEFKAFNADYYLFDTKVSGYGGKGIRFNWELLNQIRTSKPIFLAGGIDKENIHKALETNASIIDLSSSVEIDGKKDEYSIKKVIEAVRRYSA